MTGFSVITGRLAEPLSPRTETVTGCWRASSVEVVAYDELTDNVALFLPATVVACVSVREFGVITIAEPSGNFAATGRPCELDLGSGTSTLFVTPLMVIVTG